MRRATGSSVLRLFPTVWLLALVAAPLAIVLKISLSEATLAQPPYLPRFDWSAGPAGWLAGAAAFELDNYRALAADPLYGRAALGSLAMAGAATLLLLACGYPIALAISRTTGRTRAVLLALVVLPFWTSFLIRVYAWITILKPDGLLNHALLALGLIARPLVILNTDAAVLIGLVYAYLPFMVLPVVAALTRTGRDLLEAAADLGAGPMTTFWTVIWPLSRPGVVAGILVTALPIFGEFVVPDLLGGSDTQMIGRTLWVEFFSNRDWPLASALAIVMLAILAVPAVVLRERGRAGQPT